MNGSPWFKIKRPRNTTKVKVFLLHYAGGNAGVYDGWDQLIDDHIECIQVQLPGRGDRFREKPYTDMTSLIADLGEAIKGELTLPYAVFGHSLGGLVGFELVKFCRREYGKEAARLFVSACEAPRHRRPEESLKYLLPDPEFIDELRQRGEAPEEILSNNELMSILLPTIRADYQCNDTYVYKEEALLNCPISVYRGVEDPDINEEAVQLWSRETNAGVINRAFPGGHFFINQQREKVCRNIVADLMSQK